MAILTSWARHSAFPHAVARPVSLRGGRGEQPKALRYVAGAERGYVNSVLRKFVNGCRDGVSQVLIRDEQRRDRAQVRAVHLAAFDTPAEAALVDRLRAEARPIISMVALKQGYIAGHILFSPVTLSSPSPLRIMGLGPVAVMPEYQRRGIGSALVRAGLARCEELGYGAVVVLGYPEYYPRFGFIPAATVDIRCAYDVPDEAFMIYEFARAYGVKAHGTIRYHSAFDAL